MGLVVEAVSAPLRGRSVETAQHLLMDQAPAVVVVAVAAAAAMTAATLAVSGGAATVAPEAIEMASLPLDGCERAERASEWTKAERPPTVAVPDR